jgi:hypothetical protein
MCDTSLTVQRVPGDGGRSSRSGNLRVGRLSSYETDRISISIIMVLGMGLGLGTGIDTGMGNEVCIGNVHTV